ncbi:MAG: alpha-galactosidase [Chloroflexi bacterium]|nr:alpha-galactosidase [Chloroflexota bacterium]
MESPVKGAQFKWMRLRLAALVLVLAFLGTAGSAGRIVLRHATIGIEGKIVAESADAYIVYDAQSQMWEIGTSGIRRRMHYDLVDGYHLVALTNMRTGRDWVVADAAGNREVRLTLDGQTITSSDPFRLQGFETFTHPNGSLELQVSLVRGSLAVHVHYVLFPWTSVIEQWAEVENTGTTVLRNLTALDSISLSLSPSINPLTLYWVQGLTPPLEDTEEAQPLPVLRLRSLQLNYGMAQELGSTARSTEASMGWFALADEGLREGLFGGIEWSGAWRLAAKREDSWTTLQAGMQNLRHDLQPGETFSAPRRFLGFYEGDLDEAAIASHAFARSYLMRPLPFDSPWTQYNTWYAYGIALDEELLYEEVDAAAELGLEVFYVDAGWYEGSPPQGDFGWGLGTWRENRDKFPSGLATLSDYVHDRGLKFGLWVEPERVDMRLVGEEVPLKWLAPEAAMLGPAEEDMAATAQICFGNREAREWVKTWLARLVRDYRLDWLKWDNNLWMSCDPPGEAGDGNYAHIQGLYEVLDYLRAEFPQLIVENCASGGNRMDYGLMRRTDIAWLSDETDPSYRVRYHMAGASYPFPPEYLNTWLIESDFESMTQQADAATRRAWLRSRMMGAFGISANIASWLPELRAAVALEIEQYKTVRKIIANGKLYRLLPQAELTFPNLEPPSSPDAVEFLDPGNHVGVVFLFQGAVPWQQRRVLLKGLEPEVYYQITSADRTMSLRRTGEQLMTQGIRFRYAAEHPSTLLFIKPAPSGAEPEATSAPIPR